MKATATTKPPAPVTRVTYKKPVSALTKRKWALEKQAKQQYQEARANILVQTMRDRQLLEKFPAIEAALKAEGLVITAVSSPTSAANYVGIDAEPINGKFRFITKVPCWSATYPRQKARLTKKANRLTNALGDQLYPHGIINVSVSKYSLQKDPGSASKTVLISLTL